LRKAEIIEPPAFGLDRVWPGKSEVRVKALAGYWGKVIGFGANMYALV
jgi:hypothetical protein